MWIETTNFTLRLWPLEYATLRFRPVRMCRHAWQRWTRGFDDTELWSLDWRIAEFVLPRLKAFRDMGKTGCPAEFVGGDGSDADVEAGLEKFRGLLNKMILAFEYKLDEELGMPDPEMEECDTEGWGAGYRMTAKGAKEYKAAMKARQKIIDEGMALFVKYMHCLWD